MCINASWALGAVSTRMEARAEELTGSCDFKYCWLDGHWLVFCNVPRGSAVCEDSFRHWYGACLSEMSMIYQDGYKVGTAEVLGCSGWFGYSTGVDRLGRGHALDSACLWGGWLDRSRSGQVSPDGVVVSASVLVIPVWT